MDEFHCIERVVMLVMVLAFATLGHFAGYEHGQTDALHGKWKYEIVNTTEIKAKG